MTLLDQCWAWTQKWGCDQGWEAEADTLEESVPMLQELSTSNHILVNVLVKGFSDSSSLFLS